MTPATALVGSYDYRLVALSVSIAIIGAYAALDLAGHITTARGKTQMLWLFCGSTAMGLGIWTMHFIGMDAFKLPDTVAALLRYDWPTTLFSLLAAIFASAVALYLMSRPTLGWGRTGLGSLVMGGGISAMHYGGMEAMRLPAMCVYSPWLVIVSIVLAVVISGVAIRLTFAFRDKTTSLGWRRAGSGLLMGLAIPVMHYSGMAAVHFMPMDSYHGSLTHAVNVGSLEIAGITGVTVIILALVFLVSNVDRQFALQSRQFAESSLQLQTVFDHMKEAIVVVDRDRNIIQKNHAAKLLMGLPDGIVTRKEIAESFDLFLPNGAPLPAEQWPTIRALKGEFLESQEFTLRRKDTGKTTIAEISTTSIPSSIGDIAQILLSYRDVGERKLIEEARAELGVQSQRFAEGSLQLQAVFDNMSEAIIVIDWDQNEVRYNHAAMKLLSVENAVAQLESISENFEAFSPAGVLLKQEEWPITLALRGDYRQNVEVIIRRKDTGIAVTTEISTVPIPNPGGGKPKIIASFRDISERKQTDETRARLVAIVESSEDAIIGKDDEGIITNWNKGAEKLFGYPAEEIIGQSVKILLPPGHEYEEEDILARIKQGEIVNHIESLRKRKDGKLIHVSLSISPIRDGWGRVVGASKIARDITEKKQMERQLQQSQKMEAVGQLTGGIAHDFNNLLGVVIGNLDLLETLVTDNEAALKRVHTAQKGALRGADLTRRLLAFSNSEELRPSAVKLQQAAHNVIELASSALGPEIKITTHFDNSVPTVFVDAAALESALLNLVVNSRDAMPNGGSISITVELTTLEESYPPVAAGELNAGQYACVSISDTGSGMSPETLERAFEPFFTTKPRGKGTGLGLAMVYGFVKQSSGTIRIYSEVGYGTTVSIYLPLAESVELPATALAIPRHAERGATVLVVDDELDLLEIAHSYLDQIGYASLEARDGSGALDVISQHSGIDLMVTDIIMPGGMNGVELAQKVRKLRPEIKIIYCSGFPADALGERHMPKVDGPLLHKPYQRADFNAMIRHVMDGNNTELSEE